MLINSMIDSVDFIMMKIILWFKDTFLDYTDKEFPIITQPGYDAPRMLTWSIVYSFTGWMTPEPLFIFYTGL